MSARKREWLRTFPLSMPSRRTGLTCRSANANATVQCPVKPGKYFVSQTVELPKEIPKGVSRFNTGTGEIHIYRRGTDVLQPSLPLLFEDTTMTTTTWSASTCSLTSYVKPALHLVRTKLTRIDEGPSVVGNSEPILEPPSGY